MMKGKRKNVLVLAVVFTCGAHAAFDRLEASIYNDDIENYLFMDVDLLGLQLASSPAVDFQSENSLSLMPARGDAVDDFSASITAIPVPSSLWFFGSALVALTVIQRRA